jgi:hypothetical protein
MLWNGHVVLTVFLCCESDVTSTLARDFVAKRLQSFGKFGSGDIAREFHSIRSRRVNSG